MADDSRLVDLAARVADGRSVDWEAEERRTGDPAEREALRGLQLLAGIREAQRGEPPAEDGERGTGAPGLADVTLPAEQLEDYRILRKIGEGGMGEVYEAEQERPVRRKVAIKFIKWGMDTREVVARFEAERQALALMNHPNIARVFDAGVTKRGRPYFVMEHVPGVPITKYCDAHRLTTRGRLELFLELCEGVQHAHQKGVIHRDIKASNVLVKIRDAKPVPVIIDFGVAKATARRLTQRTVHTEIGHLIGTPEYMSPEQAEMTDLDIDTRTDVYALGVLLYELLTGALPFASKRLRKASFDEVLRIIREEEPSKPSTRISTRGGDASTEAARTRRTDLPVLRRQLKGDLDWITMKALEKDRTRRYQSASELAADIRRHLSHEPVLASPPGTAYRVGKFVRRNKIGVTAGLVVALAIVAAVTGTTIGFLRATRAETLAREEAEAAAQVSDFLVGLFEISDPGDARGNTITAREILDRGAERIERELREQPVVQARLMGTMGWVYFQLGLYDDAISLQRRVLDERIGLLGSNHPDTLRIKQNLGLTYYFRGRYSESERLLSEALEGFRATLGSDHPRTLKCLTDLAPLYGLKGLYAEAERLHREALDGRRRLLGDDHPSTLASMSNLAVCLKNLGRYEEAERLHRESLAAQSRISGNDHPTTLRMMDNLAVCLRNLGRHEEAERLHREALAGRRRVLSNDHPDTLTSIGNLAQCLDAQGRHQQAEPLHREVLAGRRRVSGEGNVHTLRAAINLAKGLKSQGRSEEAEELLRDALERGTRVLADDRRRATWVFSSILAGIAAALGERDESLELLRESVRRGWTAWGALDNPDFASLHGDPEFEAIVEQAKNRPEAK